MLTACPRQRLWATRHTHVFMNSKGGNMKEPGLDSRHRDKNGEISKKYGDTLVSTLRKIYGSTFAAGQPGTAKLTEVIADLNETSLSQLVHDHKNGKLDQKIKKAA
jgi:hypothetical protein